MPSPAGKWNERQTNERKTRSFSQVETLLTLSLVEEWLDTRNATVVVAHILDMSVWWLLMHWLLPHSTPCDAPISFWMAFAWQSSQGLSGVSISSAQLLSQHSFPWLWSLLNQTETIFTTFHNIQILWHWIWGLQELKAIIIKMNTNKGLTFFTLGATNLYEFHF